MARAARKDASDSEPRNLGRYRLHGEIASGGMATVHFGRQVASGGFAKTVAIKRLHPQFGSMPEFVQMFLAEARLAARIRHPNVVQPLDVLTVDDELFLVMEYVEGDSLSRLMRATLARRDKVPVPVAVSILCGVLHGLHAAHEAKSDKGEPLELVHRDVSPQNVLVGVDGISRVIDFGIAKAADSVQFTRDGELKGKLSYMAPEQLNGHKCTRRSDIYAASVILWEVLTSQRLFDADYQSAILQNILHRPVDPPSDVVPDVPKDLDVIVLKGLARDPSDRYATARDMAIALETSMPMATPSSVGSWVEVIAHKSLKARSARVTEIEAVPSEIVEEIPQEIVTDMFVETRRPPATQRGLGTPESSRPASERVSRRPPPPSARTAPPTPSARGSLPTPPTSIQPAAGRTLAGSERADPAVLGEPITQPSPHGLAFAKTVASAPAPTPAPRPPPPTIQVSETAPVAPQWPVPGIVPAQAAPVTFEPTKRASGGGVVALLLLIALGVVGVYFVAPELVRRAYVSGAERAYGMTVAIERVTVSPRQIRLLGVTGTARELPGITLRSKEVDVGLSRLAPAEMTAYDVVLEVDGPYSNVVDAFSHWRSAHPGSDKDAQLSQVTIDSAQLVWTRPFGDQTRLEAENVTAHAERTDGRPLGDDYELVAPLVDVIDGSGKVGPWPVKVTTTKRIARATLAFDASGASRATATVNVWDDDLNSIEVAVPRIPFAQLGIQPAVLGLRQDQLFLEGDAEYVVRSSSRIESHARMQMTGAHLGGAPSPSQIDVELRFAGDPKAPIEIAESSMSIGNMRTRPTGTIQIGSGYVRAELNWRSSVRCPGGGDASIATQIRLDSRNLDGSTWTTGGTHCGKGP